MVLAGALWITAPAPESAVADEAIVGGVPASEGEYPFMTSIHRQGQSPADHWCGGSVVAPRYVLTVQHCVQLIDPDGSTTPLDLEVTVGRRNLTMAAAAEQTVVVVDAIWPPAEIYATVAGTSYEPPVLLKLAEPVDQPRVTLWGGDAPALEADNITIIGWGATATDGPTSPDLLETDVQIEPGCWAGGAMGEWGWIDLQVADPAYELCVSGTVDEEPHSACAGDSGGPALVHLDGPWLQLGVLSRGVGPLCGVGAVYERVDLYGEWINQVVSNDLGVDFDVFTEQGPPSDLTLGGGISATADALPEWDGIQVLAGATVPLDLTLSNGGSVDISEISIGSSGESGDVSCATLPTVIAAGQSLSLPDCTFVSTASEGANLTLTVRVDSEVDHLQLAPSWLELTFDSVEPVWTIEQELYVPPASTPDGQVVVLQEITNRGNLQLTGPVNTECSDDLTLQLNLAPGESTGWLECVLDESDAEDGWSLVEGNVSVTGPGYRDVEEISSKAPFTAPPRKGCASPDTGTPGRLSLKGCPRAVRLVRSLGKA